MLKDQFFNASGLRFANGFSGKFSGLSKNCPDRLSKVPKPFGRISGDVILFVPSKRRSLETRSFAVILMLPLTYKEASFKE